MIKTLYFSLLLSVLISCNTEDNSAKSKIDFDGIPETIKPGDNFFEHINKTWLETVVIFTIKKYRFLINDLLFKQLDPAS